MAFALNDMIRVRVYTQLNDQIAINVLNYRIIAFSGTGPTEVQVADAFATGLSLRFRSVISNDASVLYVGINKELPLPRGEAFYSTIDAGVGAVLSPALPKQTCGIITLKTALAGRRYRGRVFTPFPGEDDNETDGIPSAAFVTRLAILGGNININYTAGIAGNQATLTPVVYSAKFGLQTPVATIVARQKWGTQRRRGSYGRPNQPPV
jgi:hypothetical protein